MKAKIYITYEIFGEALKQLNKECEVTMNTSGKHLTKDELIENLRGKDAALTMYNNPIDKEVLDAIEGVKILANYAVGYNNIDFSYAAEKNIVVSNTPGVLTDATADLTIGLIFAVARRIAESDRCVREGRFLGWTPTWYLGQSITGKTLGIIGAGRIGTEVVNKLKGFNMKILYHNRNRNLQFEKETGGTFVDKETLLKESDIISLHLPYTPETHHIIGYNELKLMKDSAILINAARGKVVDENALAKVLKENLIYGSGVDVYENEPAVDAELLTLQNVVLTPHIGSSTLEAREQMTQICVENILAAIKNQLIPNRVN